MNERKTEKVIVCKTDEKKKKVTKKRGRIIRYNDQFYISGSLDNVIPESVLDMGSYRETCLDFLDTTYRNTFVEDIVGLLRKRIYIPLPGDGIEDNLIYGDESIHCKISVSDLYYAYLNMHNNLPKKLKGMAWFLTTFAEPSYMKELLKLKIEQADYHVMMEYYQNRNQFVINFLWLLQNSKAFYIHEHDFGNCGYMEGGAYYSNFAQFYLLRATDFPWIATACCTSGWFIYKDKNNQSSVNFEYPMHYGILFKYDKVRNGETIWIDSCNLQDLINNVDSYDDLLKQIKIRNIGKVVGKDIFINPYTPAILFQNPTANLQDFFRSFTKPLKSKEKEEEKVENE